LNQVLQNRVFYINFATAGPAKLTSELNITQIYSFAIACFFCLSTHIPIAMNTVLQRVALRHNALYIAPDVISSNRSRELRSHTLFTLGQLRDSGFSLSEKALYALNAMTPEEQGQLLEMICSVFAAKMNWTPLVRDWQTPTGQTFNDMVYTFLYNVADRFSGTELPGTRLGCGHIIPDGVFDLERYTGCPFCGKPFETSAFVNHGQGSKMRVLGVMDDNDMASLMRDLLEMNTPLDASQINSLCLLMDFYPMPEGVDIKMKETLVEVMTHLISDGRSDLLSGLVKSPTDLLRFLWYSHTGYAKILRPKTLIKQNPRLWSYFCPDLPDSLTRKEQRKEALRLRFPRSLGRIVARLLNTMEMPPERMCAAMHPHREMWIHVIRALHLPEYSHRTGCEKLRNVLDRFYRKDYIVAQGLVDKARQRFDFTSTMKLLRMQPGVFARQLFANMLWFGSEPVLNEFRKVLPSLSTRLIVSLGNAAEFYFNPDSNRSVTIITGKRIEVGKNSLLYAHTTSECKKMAKQVRDLLLDALRLKYAMMPRLAASHVYIDPVLDSVLLPVGDRSLSIQDIGSAMPGMRFPVEGDKVRLFLFWGEGMHAQPIDLDLTANIFYPDRAEDCAYFNLSPLGAQHSGDIRHIPEMVGTAEYIELDLNRLSKAGARYVIFSVANYAGDTVPPNTRVGWMSSEYPMQVNAATGVAFDPSCVQMMVRIPENLASRSMLFGALDVEAREITYLELPGDRQVMTSKSAEGVFSLLEKLREKLTVGQALRMLADAQQIMPVTAEQLAADPELAGTTIVYDYSVTSDIPALMRTLIPD